MRALVTLALTVLCGCSLLLDEDELIYDIAFETGFDRNSEHWRFFDDDLVEGRGAVAGSMPTIAELNDIDIREGDELQLRLLLDGDDIVETCALPADADDCIEARPETACCIGPYIGSESDKAAAIVRIGVFRDLNRQQAGAFLEIVRNGRVLGRGYDQLFLLPQLVLGDGQNVTLDEVNDWRPDGYEAHTLFSEIRLSGTVTITEDGDQKGPTRLQATTTIQLDQSLELTASTGAGAEGIATTPRLSSSTRGAVGIFAERIALENWSGWNQHGGFDADVVLLRGQLDVTSSVDLNPCELYNDGCDSSAGRLARLDVPSPLCAEASDGDCGGSIAFLDDDWFDRANGVYAENLELGPTLTVSGDSFVVTADQDPPTIELHGFGTYTLTQRTSEGTNTLDTVSLGGGNVAPAVDLIQMVPVEVDLAPGRNRICARLGDEPTPVRFDAPEGGTCVEVVFLP